MKAVLTTSVVIVAISLILVSLQRPRGLTTVGATTPLYYDAAVLADGPQLYWPLNELSGSVRDIASKAPPSTVTRAKLGAAGPSGTAVSFDGVANRIQIPYDVDMRLAASFTIEVWAKLPAAPQTTGWPTIFSRGLTDSRRFGIAVWTESASTHRVSVKRNGRDFTTVRGLSTTDYRHLAFTFDNPSKRWTWYVDGTLDNSAVSASLSGVDTETGPMVLGAMINAAGAVVNSGKVLVDGLAMYGRALTASQISAHVAAAQKDHQTASATATPTPVRYTGGIAVGALQPWNSRRVADFQAARDLNATWIRSDLGWQYLEPVPGDWRFSVFDAVISDARAAGLRYLAILHTVPGWANGDAGDYAPPADLELMTNYCYRTALHFLPLGVTEYEIGNEVNLPHPGWAAPSGEQYATQFLVPCVTGLRRAATETGVTATVLFGSMAPTDWVGGADPVAFLTDAYQSGAHGVVDALGWHPYTGDATPLASRQMNADVEAVYSTMAQFGDGAKKIWATEYGLPTAGPNSFSESVQEAYVDSSLAVWYSRPYAGPLFWYSLRDNGTDVTDREQHFGLLRYDGAKKPAYDTLASRFTR